MSELAQNIQPELDARPAPEIAAGRFQAARSWLEEFKKQEGLEKIAIARRLGFDDNGRNQVHKFLAGNDDPVMVLAVERLRTSIEGPNGLTKWIGWRDTRCARIVIDFALKIRAAGLFGAIVGPVGAGKSEALKKVQQLTRNDGRPPVRIIRACSTSNLSGLVRGLAEEMGIKAAEVSKLHREIVRRLSARPEFLIVDEADYLLRKEPCLEFFRDLHDLTGGGILFSGQLYFLTHVWQRANLGGSPAPAEVGRLSMGGPLAAFADRLRAQVAPGLDDEEVIEIVQDVLKGTLSEDASKCLTVYVNHDFRVLSLLISVLRDLRPRAGKTLDRHLIDAAWARASHIKSRN